MDVSNEKETSCGFIFFKPKCLNKFRKIEFVLLILCLLVTTQGIVCSGFISVVLSTIEKRYDMNSVQVSLISVGYDFASILALIPISYLGGKGHKPKWIAGGSILLGIGSFMFTLPHFLSGRYLSKINEEKKILCGNIPVNVSQPLNSTAIYTVVDIQTPLEDLPFNCQGIPQSQTNIYLIILLAANMFNAVGSAPLYTLAVSYFDENLNRDKSPLFFGLYYACAMIGPALGYISKGMLLKVYIDFEKIDTKKLIIGPEHPGWLGAWWLGFLITGFIFFLLAIPVSMFPNEMPEKRKLQLAKVKAKENSLLANSGTNVFQVLKSLLSNHIYNFINFSGCAEGALIAGFLVFAPKYVEATYHLPASVAGQLIGVATIPPGCIGMILGGFLVRRFHMGALQSLRFSMFFVAVAFFLSFGVGLSCPEINYAGVNYPYVGFLNGSSRITKNMKDMLDSQCNSNCNCSKYAIDPVCGRDGITYMSPCYAGCASLNSIKFTDENIEKISYEECSCIEERLTNHPYFKGRHNFSAIAGTCKPKCNRIYIFLAMYSCMIFIVFIIWTPILTSTLKLVSEEHKSIALAVQWIVARVFGMIPSRILFGKIIDKACMLWQVNECTKSHGSCWVYTTNNLSIFFMAVVLILKIFSFTFLYIASRLVVKYLPVSIHSENQ